MAGRPMRLRTCLQFSTSSNAAMVSRLFLPWLWSSAAAQRFHVRPMMEPAIRRAIGLMVAHGVKMGQFLIRTEIS